MPQVGRKPHFVCVSPIFASLATIMRSQASASSNAPVKQKPLTLAMVILGIVAKSSVTRLAGPLSTSATLPPATGMVARALRSTPAENARPAPVSTTSRTPSSLAASSSAASSSPSRSGGQGIESLGPIQSNRANGADIVNKKHPKMLTRRCARRSLEAANEARTCRGSSCPGAHRDTCVPHLIG